MSKSKWKDARYDIRDGDDVSIFTLVLSSVWISTQCNAIIWNNSNIINIDLLNSLGLTHPRNWV